VSKDRHHIYAMALAAGLVCLAVYLRALTCGFVNLDDPEYVLNNAAIRHLDRNLVVTAFTGATAGFWMPLTWVSLALDHQVWGLNPLGYHLTNVLLHAVNAGLVVLIADRLCRKRFAEEWEKTGQAYLYPGMLLLAGLLFGIHPLRVESVAWVTERKDVLNGLFSLGSVYCYLRYAQQQEGGAAGHASRLWYPFSFALFGLSLMAKSVSVVLPAMFLVADWYPLGRLRQGRLWPPVAEKLPFLFLSGAMSVATLYFTAQSRFLVSYDDFPLGQRLLVSGNAVYEYVRLFLVPTGISPLHVIPDPIPTAYAVTTALVAVVCVGAAAARKSRWVPAVWLAFLLPLLPVLAFFQNGDQSFASRFTYLPSVVPGIAAAAAIVSVAARGGSLLLRREAFAVAALLLLVHAGMTYRLIGVWQDTGTVWSRAIDLEPQAILFKERGIYYHGAGRYDAAIADYTAAIERAPAGLEPYIYNLYACRGEALRAAGRHAEAVADLTTAITLYPHPEYFHFRAAALKELGRIQEAAADAARAGEATGPLGWHWDKHEQQK
jgi:protein O-mannosyl-transferase